MNEFGFVADNEINDNFGFVADVEKVKTQPVKPHLTEEQKQAEIARIKAEYEARNREIDREHRKQMAKLYGGALLEIGSAAIPVGAGLRLGGLALKAGKPIAQQVIKNLATRGAIEGGLSGLIGGVGRGMVEDKDLKGIGQTALTDAGIGLVGGAGLGAIGGKIATNVGKTGQRIKNIEAKQLAKKQPQVTKEVKAEVVEQPIKQVEEVVENIPQQKVNLNTLKSNIRANKFEDKKIETIKHRYKNAYYTTTADPVNADLIKSEREFNNIITEMINVI